MPVWGRGELTDGGFHLTCETVFWLMKIFRHMFLTIEHLAWRVNFIIVSMMNNCLCFKLSDRVLVLTWTFRSCQILCNENMANCWSMVIHIILMTYAVGGENRASLLNHCLLGLFDSNTLNMILESHTMCLATSLINSYICR